MTVTRRCIHGHLYTPENTRVTRQGSWVCRTCLRQRNRQMYARYFRSWRVEAKQKHA